MKTMVTSRQDPPHSRLEVVLGVLDGPHLLATPHKLNKLLGRVFAAAHLTADDISSYDEGQQASAGKLFDLICYVGNRMVSAQISLH